MAENPARRENTGNEDRPPRTALGEVLREFENAETDVDDTRERRHRGEAGEAITTNVRAQEESEGD
ncbi:hypothetical protein C1I97_11225 [Streptomyces sp. NTH33]|uniref:hypothetical protein n=1 Tax=Streptomyces sp. NTH33 TaxID=1735453 RepID=UPI000DA8B5BE|nr:hypothetical protein [Streptomyces sp. NTH33]PZH13398.1 hypothetical protein C1I97_11225 [Streptomyces sp. NTH33]